MPTDKITTLNSEEGQSLSIAGGIYRILISGEQTNGSHAVIEMLVPSGSGPGPHAHKDIQEMFYVVDGEVEFKTEDGKYLAKKGAFVNIPLGGEVHCFKNVSDKMAHLLCTVVPAGLDAFFKEIGQPTEHGKFLPPPNLRPEDIAQLQLIAERYGQKLYPPDFLG